MPSGNFPDFFRFSLISHSKISNSSGIIIFKNWKSFLYGSETFISAILVSRTKIMIPPGTHSSGRISENLKIWNLADSHHPTVETSGCLAASPRSLGTRLHPIHDTLRVKNLPVGWKFHLYLTYPSEIQETAMGNPKKCMNISNKTSKFQTFSPSCYHGLM